MGRIAMFAILATFVTASPGQGPEPKLMAEPPLPFYDWKACPFEGCVYRSWVARQAAVVYDTWQPRRKPVGKLANGDRVLALTGVVITFKPGVVRLDHDLDEYGLNRGDTILTYTYRGEGASAVWFKGRFYSEFDLSFVKAPDGQACAEAQCAGILTDPGRKVWWAQVKLESGRTGWVNMNEAKFDGVDLLAVLVPTNCGRSCSSDTTA